MTNRLGGSWKPWKAVDLRNPNAPQAKEDFWYNVKAFLQRGRDKWLAMRVEFNIRNHQPQVPMPEGDRATWGATEWVKNCLHCISQDLDHTSMEDLSDGGHREVHDNERAALLALDDLSTYVEREGTPHDLVEDSLQKHLAGYRANQLQQLRMNCERLNAKDKTALWASLAPGDPSGKKALRQEFLDLFHTGCNKRLMFEKRYGWHHIETTGSPAAPPLPPPAVEPAPVQGDYARSRVDTPLLPPPPAYEPPPLPDAPPPRAVEAPSPPADAAPSPPLNVSGHGASNGSTGETSASGISPADPEQKKVANGELQQSATSMRKRKRNGRGHQRLASEDLPRQPEPEPLLRHQRLASADLPRQRPPQSVMRSRDRASPNTAVPVSPRLESTPNVPSRVVSEAASERPDAATTGNGRSAGGQLLALAVPPAEASATVSAPSQPQVLSESMIGQPETGTPAMRATEAQPTSKQGTAEMELSLQYMNDLMEKMKSRNLSAVFEILNKLADPKLQPYRARSLEKVTEKMTLPNETMLQYVNNDMNLIRQDLKSNNDFARGLPKIKRERVEALVEEWFKLDLTKAKPAELPRWAETEVREILNNRDLAPPTRADQPAATLNVQWPPRN
jgi:hypothetical protein